MLDLIERLEKATGPNFELEHQIAEAVYPHLRGFRQPGAAGWVGPGWSRSAPPPYTASLGAITALIGEKLPDVNLKLYVQPEKTMAELWYAEVHRAEAKTAPLALCVALLRTLSRDNGNGG